MIARKPAKPTSPRRSAHARRTAPAGVEPRQTAAQRVKDQPVALRFDELPRDLGWVLVYVGVLGVILPGIPGLPFVIAGGAVLLPGGPRLLDRWVGRKPPRVVHASIKQIARLVDDLERRYPRLPQDPS